jgi:hypothetical protein
LLACERFLLHIAILLMERLAGGGKFWLFREAGRWRWKRRDLIAVLERCEEGFLLFEVGFGSWKFCGEV